MSGDPASFHVSPTKIVRDDRRLLDTESSVMALPVWPGDNDAAGPLIGPSGADVAEELGLDLVAVTEREKTPAKAGKITSVPVFGAGRGAGSADGDVDVERVVLVGLGDGSVEAYRTAGAALARAGRGSGRVATTVAASADDACLRAFVEGAVLATYVLGDFRSKPVGDGKQPMRELVLTGIGDERDAVVAAAAAVATAVWSARDLIHTPSSVKDPAWLAARAEDIGKSAGLAVRVRDERALAAEGFGGIVAVGMGSIRPPRLIALRYEPDGAAKSGARDERSDERDRPERAAKAQSEERAERLSAARQHGDDLPHIVLVGKGITFDSGGLSLKPRTSMVGMKTDMSGGAVVLGVMSALRALRVPVRVTGLVAAAENMPGARAQRPGDVIKQYDGTTVEVLNTDAEGRLVLADALAYAVAELDPSVVVDVATLTGAATVALGRTHAAMYATLGSLADALVGAGAAAGEPLWRMPLVDDYEELLRSEVADVAHVSSSKYGGSITAALFLRRFVREVPWAHLDIAGAGRAEKDADVVVKGGTAFGVRALLYWLESGAEVGTQ